ncbi:MAG: HpcH/HpaI aldolase/citrate lyase family protein [Nitrospinota bacterium]
MEENKVKRKLARGEPAIGVGVRAFRSIEAPKMMATAGFDWLFVDTEHTSFNLETAGDLCKAAIDAGITPVVRVGGLEYHLASRALDSGAQGVCFPHINSAEEARRAAANSKYPPQGHRSIAGGMVFTGYAPAPLEELTRWLNQETLLITMVESAEAVERAEEIAAVEGVDVLLIGTSDLSTEMGIPGQLEHPRVAEAYERVIAACRKHGKVPGMGGVYSPPLIAKRAEMGMRFILSGSDLEFLFAGARERCEAVKRLFA